MIFTNVIKPTHLCNLDCKYCYNDDVRDPIMKEETLQRVIEETFQYVRQHTPNRHVNFIWHGGEPTIPGVAFYKRVIQLQKQFGDGVSHDNSIQTNGVLIDDKWLNFLKKSNFSVSISIDGPKQLHDEYRVDRGGKGSFDRVLQAISRIQEADIPLGLCVVVSRANKDYTEEIYDFIAPLGIPFNVIPMNRSGGARTHYDELGLDAEEYAEPWIRMYDRWFDADQDYVYCSDFVFKTRAILAGKPADCIGLSHCSETNISVDPVGDVYPCATLSGSSDTKYGNLVESDLTTIMNDRVARSYRGRRADPQCQECRWQHVCHGGCLARAYKFFGDHHHRDYYCPSLFRIYEHIASRLSDTFSVTNYVPAPERPVTRRPAESMEGYIPLPVVH
jgi:uncharacterized protein